MSSEYVGKTMRFIMENHRKGRPINKFEIKDLLSISTSEAMNVLKDVDTFLLDFSLELVGLNGNEIVSIEEAKKIFIRKTLKETTKKIKPSLTEDDCRMFLIFALIQIENNSLESSKIHQIQRCKYFSNCKASDYMDFLKSSGYLSTRKEDDVVYWSLGWRFYVEYCDVFDIFEYFERLNSDYQAIDFKSEI